VRVGVLASGGGSNLQAIIDFFAASGSTGGSSLWWVGSDRADAGALERARVGSVTAAVVIAPADGEAMLAQLQAAGVELLVLAGYLKLVPTEVVRAYYGRLLNIHPALLPAFGGVGMYGARIHAAVLAHGATVTGATVHFVDEEFDRGPIVAQWPVPVLPGDTTASLAHRVLQIEHRLYPLCIAAVARRTIVLGADGIVHGHLDVPLSPGAPALRFALRADDAVEHPGLLSSFALDLARLFPR